MFVVVNMAAFEAFIRGHTKLHLIHSKLIYLPIDYHKVKQAVQEDNNNIRQLFGHEIQWAEYFRRRDDIFGEIGK